MATSGISTERAEYNLYAPQFRERPSGLNQAHVDGWQQGRMSSSSNGTATERLVGQPTTGLLLVASDLRLIYANAEAIQILAYAEPPESLELLEDFLARKIRSVLLVNENNGHQAFATQFISGRRRYVCRAFSLNNNAPDHPALAVILERSRRTSFAAQVATQFHLTPREWETLQYLMEGLTNKEIGHRMKISPNTVKGFLKLIMMKMGVSTRSGIIGKTVNPLLQRASLISSTNDPFGE